MISSMSSIGQMQGVVVSFSAKSDKKPGHHKRKLRVYLSGPDVFTREPIKIANMKKAICKKAGFEGIFPLDNQIDTTGLSLEEIGIKISKANEDLMDNCDLIISNMTPFRSPSTDPGTAFEMGYMRSQGKPVYAYTNNQKGYVERIKDFFKGAIQKRDDGTQEDPQQMSLEDFNLTDNLMLDGAVYQSGGYLAKPDSPVSSENIFSSLESFEHVVQRAARDLIEKEKAA